MEQGVARSKAASEYQPVPILWLVCQARLYLIVRSIHMLLSCTGCWWKYKSTNLALHLKIAATVEEVFKQQRKRERLGREGGADRDRGRGRKREGNV